MANVLNRTTKQYIKSANTPDYPVADWIIDPDMSAVTGQPSKYWVITGDTVSLADQPTRDVIDAAEQSAKRDNVVAQLDQVEDVLRAFMLGVIDELNILRSQFNATTGEVAQLTTTTFNDRTVAQLKTAIRNKLGS